MMNAEEIKSYFNDVSGKLAQEDDNRRAYAIARDLSAALDALQAGGVDVSFKPFGFPVQRAFEISPDCAAMPVSGILTIGHNEYLLGIETRRTGRSYGVNPCNVLVWGMLDHRYSSTEDNKKVRHFYYDLDEEPAAFDRFQKDVTLRFARDVLVAKQDTSQAFDNVRVPRAYDVQKPLLRAIEIQPEIMKIA